MPKKPRPRRPQSQPSEEEEDVQQAADTIVKAENNGEVEIGEEEGVDGRGTGTGGLSTSKPGGSSSSAMPVPSSASRREAPPDHDIPPFPGSWY